MDKKKTGAAEYRKQYWEVSEKRKNKSLNEFTMLIEYNRSYAARKLHACHQKHKAKSKSIKGK